MSLHATLDVTPVRESSPGATQTDASYGRSIEEWLHCRLEPIAVAVTFAGLALRVHAASGTYLNPDEALQYVKSNQPSALLVYQAGRTLAHPPLYYFLIYYWHLLGRSELMLRLPSVVLGTAVCWVTFKWVERLFGKAAGLIALILVAFCPTLIALSAEVRQYALLLFCMSLSLYFLARAFERQSVASIWWFSGFLWLAILSHYSAAFFVLSAGLYSLIRMADLRFPRKLALAWACGQVAAFGVYVFLYVTHLSKMKASLSLWALDLDQSYFRPYRDDIFAFTGRQTLEFFKYLFARSYISELMLVLFTAAAVFLFARDLLVPSSKRLRFGMLLVLPFLTIWGAAIAGIYPYVPTRHSVFLAPFAIAASSFLLAALCRQRLWAGILIASAMMLVANASAAPVETIFNKEDQRRSLMLGAIDRVHESIPASDTIFVDYQTSLPLGYYLCGPEQIISIDTGNPDFDQFTCSGYHIVSAHFWKLRADAFAPPFQKLARSFGLRPGDRVWVFQAGWGGNMVTDLQRLTPAFHCLSPWIFGNNISIVPLMVGLDSSPIPQTTCHD